MSEMMSSAMPAGTQPVNIFHSPNADSNSWAAIIPALMSKHHGGDWGGLGAGFVGGVVGGALFNRRGGLFGDNDCGSGGGETRIESDIFNTAVLSKLGTIEAAIPASAAATTAAVNSGVSELTNVTLQQTIALERDLGSLALGTQQAFANTKDAIQAQNTALAAAICGVNQNVSSQGCQTREAVQNDGDKTRALLVSRFQLEDATRINELNARVIELQSEGRRRSDHDDLRLQITNTNTAIAAQAQGQQQQQQQQQFAVLQSLVPLVNSLIVESQVARATNANLIIGSTGVATGAQTANPVNVR